MLHIRRMTEADIPLGMALKLQNGWNQLEGDWRRLLAMEPDGCFVAELDGVGVGTAGTCVFGPVAWVAMMLVEASQRKHGIGTALMQAALAYLDGRGVVSVRLDATPLGRPVYEKLGFSAEFELARFEGIPPPSAPPFDLEPVASEQLPEMCQLDQSVTRTDRRKLITRLHSERPEIMRQVRRDGKIVGLATARPGARAWLLGPCLGDAEAGKLLFAYLFHRFAGQPVFLDIPLANRPAVALAESKGLKVQRHLLRMGRGPRIQEQVEALWSGSGPEKG
jgi:GNAT superfamily N-acetyltransferase